MCTDTRGTFLVFFFCHDTRAPLVYQYGLPLFAPRLSSHLSVWSIIKSKKRSLSVHLSKPFCRWKKECNSYQSSVLPPDVRNGDDCKLIIKWAESRGCFICWNAVAMCSGCLVTCACTFNIILFYEWHLSENVSLEESFLVPNPPTYTSMVKQ